MENGLKINNIRQYILEQHLILEFTKVLDKSEKLMKSPNTLEKGLKKTKENLDQELTKLKKEYPEEKKKLEKFEKKVKIISKKSDKFDIWPDLEVKKKLISEAVKEFRDTSLKNKLIGIGTGIIGSLILIKVQVKLINKITEKIFRSFPNLGLRGAYGISLIISSAFIAPITEEFFKFITLKLNKNIIPTFVFSIIEFSIYIYGVLITKPILLIIMLISRLKVLQFHLSTAEVIRKAIKDKKPTDILKGHLMHFKWNLLHIGGLKQLFKEIKNIFKNKSILIQDLVSIVK